jgi:hypothetical protein
MSVWKELVCDSTTVNKLAGYAYFYGKKYDTSTANFIEGLTKRDFRNNVDTAAIFQKKNGMYFIIRHNNSTTSPFGGCCCVPEACVLPTTKDLIDWLDQVPLAAASALIDKLLTEQAQVEDVQS